MRSLFSSNGSGRYVVWVGLLAAASASSACVWNQACTLAGCIDQASLSLRENDGSFAPLVLEVGIDERIVHCHTEIVGAGVCDDAKVSLSAQERVDCVDTRSKDAVSQSCTPNGTFEHALLIEGSPTRITLKVTRSDGTTEQREFKPEYELERPNGPDCDPVCKNAAVVWTL
jgi:hypothetical protein